MTPPPFSLAPSQRGEATPRLNWGQFQTLNAEQAAQAARLCVPVYLLHFAHFSLFLKSVLF